MQKTQYADFVCFILFFNSQQMPTLIEILSNGYGLKIIINGFFPSEWTLILFFPHIKLDYLKS